MENCGGKSKLEELGYLGQLPVNGAGLPRQTLERFADIGLRRGKPEVRSCC